MTVINKVFLGGTCNGSQWRETFIPLLTVPAFNPVVPNWNEEAYKLELHEREHDRVLLYTLTPKMTGFYSVAEVVDDSNKRPDRTAALFLYEDEGESFSEHQRKGMVALEKMLTENGVPVFTDMQACADWCNKTIAS